MLEPAILFLVFFGPLAFGCVEPWSLAILQVVLFSLPMLAGAEDGRPRPPAPRALLMGVGVVLAVGIVQTLTLAAPDGPSPLLPFTASAWRTKNALLLWLSYGVLLGVASRAFADSRAGRRFPWAILLVGLTISVIGLIQSSHGNAFVLGFREVPYGRSPFGPYYNNAHAASLLAVTALMGLGLLGSEVVRTFSREAREPRADAIAYHILLAFLIVLILLGLYATRNRGSLFALGGAATSIALLACGFLTRSARRWGARAAIILLFLGAGSAAVQFGLLKRGATVSIPARLSMYKSGLTALADFPVWGAGLGTVITVFEPYKEAVVDGIVDHVHNDWLELPMQAGVPAAALVLAALGVFGLRVYRGWMREPSWERRCIVGGGIAAALCFLLHAMVEFTWQIPANAVIFLLILSWLWSQTEGRVGAAPAGTPRLSTRAVAAVASVVLALLALRPAVGWALAREGRYSSAFAWDANPDYLRRLSIQHFKAGRLQPALAAAGSALEMEPLLPDYQVLHAHLLAQLQAAAPNPQKLYNTQRK